MNSLLNDIDKASSSDLSQQDSAVLFKYRPAMPTEKQCRFYFSNYWL